MQPKQKFPHVPPTADSETDSCDDSLAFPLLLGVFAVPIGHTGFL